MPLIRGFSEIDKDGKMSISSNIRKEADLDLAGPVGVKVVRIKGSIRWPYLVVYHPRSNPRFSRFEVTMMESRGDIGESGRLTLEPGVLGEAKFEPHYRAEIKVAGPKRGSWLVIRNRGPNRLTTLQEKMGHRRSAGKSGKKWQTQKWEY